VATIVSFAARKPPKVIFMLVVVIVVAAACDVGSSLLSFSREAKEFPSINYEARRLETELI